MKKILSAILLVVASVVGVANAQQPQTSTAPLSSTNVKYNNGVGNGYWPTKGTGLVLNVAAGTSYCSGAISTYAGGTLTLTDNSTNYVFLSSSCVLGFNTTGFVAGNVPIAVVTTVSGAITTIQDDRTMFASIPTSGAGNLPNFVPVTINLGDSLALVEQQNVDMTSNTSCDGVTCFDTTTNPSYYYVGQWYNHYGQIATVCTTGNTTGGSNPCLVFSPSCMEFSFVQVTAIVGNQIFYKESDTVTPTLAGCTGVVSGSGGANQDATYMWPMQLSNYPIITNGGTATPVTKNRAWPGENIDTGASNITAKVSDYAPNTTHVPAQVILDWQSVCSNSEADYKSATQTIWTGLHSMGFKVVQLTLFYGVPTICGISVGDNSQFVIDINNWFRQHQCGYHASYLGTTACADSVIDIASYGVSNTALFQQGPPFSPHMTNAGGILTASVIANGLMLGNLNSNGVPNFGQNNYYGYQIAPGFQFGSQQFTANTPAGEIEVGFGRYFNLAFSGSHFTYLSRSGPCFVHNTDSGGDTDYFASPDNCITGDNRYTHTLDIGSGGVEPFALNQNDDTGNIAFGQVYPHQFTGGNPAYVKNGQIFYRSDLNQWCQYTSSSTTVCGWGSSSGGALNGTVTYTSSQTASIGDNGKLVIMNCSSACSYALPASQPSTTWVVWVQSVGSTVATITLAGGDTYNGTAGVPVLNSFRPIQIFANTTTATDYRGDAPITATTPIVITPSANGFNVACPSCSTGGGTTINLPSNSSVGSLTVTGEVPLLLSDTSGSGTSQTATSSPTFTPANGVCWTYQTTTANTSTALTVSINGLSKSVAVSGTSGWTTTLTTGQVPANEPLKMCYDGTNYNVFATGILPASGGGGACMTPITVTTTGSAANMNFPTIPGTCQKLIFDCQVSSNDGSGGHNVFMTVNGDAAGGNAHYDWVVLDGGYSQSPVVASAQNDQDSWLVGFTIRRDGGFPIFTVEIPQYTFGFASYFARYVEPCYTTSPACHGRLHVDSVGGEYRGGGAVTSANIFVSGDTFFDGSKCTVHGE